MQSIDTLEIGHEVVIEKVGGEGATRTHFLDMGLIPGARLKVVAKAPLGDPIQLLISGYALTLRKADAAGIEVRELEPGEQEGVCAAGPGDSSDRGRNAWLHDHNAHPGLGEGGKYHSRDHENPLPKGVKLSLALAGQQNCGKTTLFNVLTGSNQHVGNFPGVTVDRKEGVIKGHPESSITDLPGIYSLSPYTAEELVSREFILDPNTRGLINIVDASNIERNLYLTLQLMELGVPMVLALNMMDEVRGNGGAIRINEMERILGIPVVGISAARGEGVDELVEHALHVARYQEAPARNDFCGKDDNGGAVHRCLHSVIHLVEDRAAAAGIPARFAATKLIEGDDWVEKALKLSPGEREAIEQIILTMEQERGIDRAAAIADMRYTFIRKLCAQTVVKPRESKEYRRSRRIDKVLTGRWTAIPIFVLIMALVIWLTIDVLGAPLQALLDAGISTLGAGAGALLAGWGVSPAVQSLVVDAVFGGVGSVCSFVPVIVILFFFLSMLEDSGYMARVAYVTDSFLRKLGLSGRSIVPLIIGLGCSVPGVMASRTLPSARDRRKTILLTPFMSCSAKLPIYAFLSSAFFPGRGGLVLVCLYLLSICIGILVALIGKLIDCGSQAAPFVMELPNYRLPQLRNVGHLMWDKTKDFLQRAFTVIFVATLVIWFLQSFDFRFNMVQNGEGSMLAWIAGIMAPLFAPLGLGDWKIVTAFISGFLAKESVVATMEVLGVLSTLTVASSVSMLVFSLLYTPCVAAIAAVKRELGGKWALFVIVFQCIVAWLAAFGAYRLALLVL
ncbi:MAG: ferrous iron transport protein B [Bacteroidales bacterium]|nr:ferrous iron transport protein B [Bacteroidales bacterium]